MTLPLALALGPAVAFLVWCAGLLDARASLAAAALGSAAALAGGAGVVLLLAFFGSSVALGRLGRPAKRARTRATLDDEQARRARQVLANGALFGGGALLAVLAPAHDHAARAAALGALAAATADTWATEVGLAVGVTPRHILTLRPLAPGLSGGVTVAGTAATVAGAALLAALAAALGWPAAVAWGGAAGGVAGSLADSVLGATLQARRRTADGALTERTRGVDGTTTMHASGLPWVDNDVVNFAATAVGALVATLVLRGATP